MTFLKQKTPVSVYFQAILSYLKMVVAVLARELDEGGLKLRAMSLVYTSLLSLAPLLAVSFSILKGFGVHNQVEPLLLELLAPLGGKGAELTANIIGFVENIQVGVLGFVGFLMLFYTVVSLIGQIEACFNHVWRVAKPRSLYRRFSDYLSAVLIGPVLLFSAVGIMASMSSSDVVQRMISQESFGTAFYLVGLFLPYLLISLAFAFAYSFIPNTTVKLGPALIGGLVAGVAWKITGMLFAQFLADSAQYSAIYSGFAVILLSMIWLYISWLILLLGGVIVFHVQFPHYLRYTTRRPHLSIQCQEQLAIMLMALIGRQHIHGGAVCTLNSLADQFGLPGEPVAEILDCLTRHGFLMTLRDDEHGYVLVRDTDTILLKDIMRVIRAEGYQVQIASQLAAAGSAMQNLMASLEKNPELVLQERCLRELIVD